MYIILFRLPHSTPKLLSIWRASATFRFHGRRKTYDISCVVCREWGDCRPRLFLPLFILLQQGLGVVHLGVRGEAFKGVGCGEEVAGAAFKGDLVPAGLLGWGKMGGGR